MLHKGNCLRIKDDLRFPGICEIELTPVLPHNAFILLQYRNKHFLPDMDSRFLSTAESRHQRTRANCVASPYHTVEALLQTVHHPSWKWIATGNHIVHIQRCPSGTSQFHQTEKRLGRSYHCIGMRIKGQPQQFLPSVIRSPNHRYCTADFNCSFEYSSQTGRPLIRKADQNRFQKGQKGFHLIGKVLTGRLQCFRCRFQFIEFLITVIHQKMSPLSFYPIYSKRIPAASQAATVS